MSFRIVKEVRAALKAGRIVLPGKTGPLDRLVLLLLADDARDDTRQASVGMAELSAITGVHRNTIGSSVGRLEKAANIRASRGGRDTDGTRKAATYQFPPDFGCTPKDCASNSKLDAQPTSASNTKLDAQLGELDAQVGAVGCTTQGCALPGSTPGSTPGGEKSSSLRSDDKEIPRSQAHAATTTTPRIPVEPVKVPLHLSVLRKHFTGDPLTLRELGRLHFRVKEPTKPQMESIRAALLRDTKRGLVEIDYNFGPAMAFRPVPTTNWTEDEIGSDMSRAPSRIPERR